MTQTDPLTNIAETIADLSRSQGDEFAFRIIAEQGAWPASVTFGELHELVSNCAGGLREQGIKRGSRVVVFVPMSLDLYVVLLALFRLGAVAVFIDPWGGRAMIESAAALVDADAFIGIGKAHLLRATSPTIRRIKVHIVAGDGRASAASSRLPRTVSLSDLMADGRRAPVTTTAAVSAHDPALITFTGGTTGIPKGANRTHGFLAAQHDVLTRNIELAPEELCLTNLPIVVLHGLGRGVTTVLPPPALAQDPKVDGTWLHGLIEDLGVNVLALSPAPLDGISRSRNRSPLRSVARVYTGGGPVLPELIERAQPLLSGAQMVAIYGSTEAEPIAHANAVDVLARRDQMRASGGIWVGNAVPDVEVMLVRSDPGPIEIADGAHLSDWRVSPGAAGEILVCGPHVNQEYFANPDAFRENKTRDEAGRIWHRTGDIARQDPDGGLWLLGRRGADLRLGGRRVWPLEIETPLTDLPTITRAAVCTPKFEGSNREFKNASAVVAVEPADGASRATARDAAIGNLRERALDGFLEVRSLQRIPVDKRHGTKIDTDSLRAKLKPRDTSDY